MDASVDGLLNEAEWKNWIGFMVQIKLHSLTLSVSDKDESFSVLNKSALSNGKWTDADFKEPGFNVRAFVRTFKDK